LTSPTNDNGRRSEDQRPLRAARERRVNAAASGQRDSRLSSIASHSFAKPEIRIRRLYEEPRVARYSAIAASSFSASSSGNSSAAMISQIESSFAARPFFEPCQQEA